MLVILTQALFASFTSKDIEAFWVDDRLPHAVLFIPFQKRVRLRNERQVRNTGIKRGTQRQRWLHAPVTTVTLSDSDAAALASVSSYYSSRSFPLCHVPPVRYDCVRAGPLTLHQCHVYKALTPTDDCTQTGGRSNELASALLWEESESWQLLDTSATVCLMWCFLQFFPFVLVWVVDRCENAAAVTMTNLGPHANTGVTQ